MDALVAAQYPPGGVDDGAGLIDLGRALRHEGGVIIVGDEADLLAVRLVCHRQAGPAWVLAARVLRPVADREHGARELLLRQREKEIRLILRRVGAALQEVMPALRIAL